MNPLALAIGRSIADLRDCGAAYALVGGLAVSARAEPRMTRDLDLVVAVTSDREAEALVKALAIRGYTVRALVEQEARARLATVRLTHGPTNADIVDLLFASSGIEPEIVEAAESMEIIPGLFVPVARIGHLLALKLLARDDRRRPQDADDLHALLAVATPEDLEVCAHALALITERGYDRGRDLVASWDQVLRHGPWGP